MRSGAIGDVLHVHGSYVQDWLLYPTDFNWRVLKSEGGELRAVGDIGTHWLDLVGFVSGLDVEAVMADLKTVHATRLKPPAGSIETFKGKESGQPVEREPVPIDTEDFGAILLRYKGGARGVLTVSQVTAGRKNCLRYELAGSKKSLYFNSETPNSLWIGERGEPNRELLRDPSLLDADASPVCELPGRPQRGLPRHVQAALSRGVHRRAERQAIPGAVLCDVRRWPQGSRALRGHREEPHGAAVDRGRRLICMRAPVDCPAARWSRCCPNLDSELPDVEPELQFRRTAPAHGLQ